MKTWKDVQFTDVFPDRKKHRVIGLTFPECNTSLGLEPSVLSVLPPDEECEYSMKNIDFNDDDVDKYVCSVYIAGMEEFKSWALRHDRNKIVVGGYHPTMFPEEFVNYAGKIVIGCCDGGAFWETIVPVNQIVLGKVNHKAMPRYDLYNVNYNQQIIPDKAYGDICTSINTSMGCPMKCDFCCSPVMCPELVSKPIELVEKEVNYLAGLEPQWLFIRDENFPMQKDWKQRLDIIKRTRANIYMFASANFLTEEAVKYMAESGVYMVCLGLENINTEYNKNKNLDNAVALLKKYNIYTYLSFIVNPLEIIGQEEGRDFYDRLMKRFYELMPEMVTGNFLMPFKGTGLWDKYYAFVDESDYKDYDSKSAFLIKNKVVREKMEFFMFYYQWLYYTSDAYNKMRYPRNGRFENGYDTLTGRFKELYEYFRPKYEHLWNVRA